MGDRSGRGDAVVDRFWGETEVPGGTRAGELRESSVVLDGEGARRQGAREEHRQRQLHRRGRDADRDRKSAAGRGECERKVEDDRRFEVCECVPQRHGFYAGDAEQTRGADRAEGHGDDHDGRGAGVLSGADAQDESEILRVEARRAMDPADDPRVRSGSRAVHIYEDYATSAALRAQPADSRLELHRRQHLGGGEGADGRGAGDRAAAVLESRVGVQ